MAAGSIVEPPPGVKNLEGERFGRLVVLRFSHKVRKHNKWVCQCDCGNLAVRRQDHLVAGRAASCGCLAVDRQKENFQKHGGAVSNKSQRHPLYSIWCGIKKRCHSEKCNTYAYYGARGITVCDEWREDFESFVRDMGPRPPGTSLDRIDNDGGYFPDNCRWADRSTQMKNRRPFKRKQRNEPGVTESC